VAQGSWAKGILDESQEETERSKNSPFSSLELEGNDDILTTILLASYECASPAEAARLLLGNTSSTNSGRQFIVPEPDR
jgi:hypothetical protein